MRSVTATPSQKLLLFDVDGTLVSWAGQAGAAFAAALEHAVGREVDMTNYSFAGRTDPQIARFLLQRAGVVEADLERSISLVIEHYLQGFANMIPTITGARLCPGVRPLLSRLDAEPRAMLGLLTGNVERGADLKLGHFGIRDFFATGAFGSDREDRNELLPIAVDRVFARSAVRFDNGDVVVIGDTPADVECAHVHGALAVGVATGTHSAADLLGAGADLLFDDLSDTDRVTASLLNGVAPGRRK